ncbi:MAG TPA: amidohydrolase family protein, partial [Firmicutes bacterium]|nr:amidohydrolase family protein [Bacillota bacterium]
EDGPRGAHPRQFVSFPDWEEFQRLQELAQGAIRIITLAPELPHALEFIEKAVAEGVVVGIGHTNATAKEVKAAVACGATLSTHLGNGCHAVLPRHADYIYEQLGNDGLMASFIADGKHLPANVLKSFIRAKGVQRSILISDAVSLTGLPDGAYTLWGQQVEVLRDKVVLAGTEYLAGAVSLLPVGVFNAVKLAGCLLEEAIDMASLNPLRLLGQKQRGLQVGAPANLIVFQMNDQDLAIKYVYCQGSRMDCSLEIGA